jgi:hypothetical protein
VANATWASALVASIASARRAAARADAYAASGAATRSSASAQWATARPACAAAQPESSSMADRNDSTARGISDREAAIRQARPRPISSDTSGLAGSTPIGHFIDSGSAGGRVDA